MGLCSIKTVECILGQSHRKLNSGAGDSMRDALVDAKVHSNIFIFVQVTKMKGNLVLIFMHHNHPREFRLELYPEASVVRRPVV